MTIASSIAVAQSLVEEHRGYFMPIQFENPANPAAHEKTTAVGILAAAGERIDAFVAGVGTGGTITGVGRVLKREIPGIQIVAVEPKESAVLSGNKPGLHGIQGIGAGFIPKVLDLGLLDEIVRVSSEDAFNAMRELTSSEGIFAGVSSGAAAVAALSAARRLGPGHTVATLFPDSRERYLSTVL